MAVTLLLALSGCALNGAGLAWSEVVYARGAVVVVTHVPGVALRSAREDAGLSIGYTRTLAIAPLGAAAPAQGRYGPGAVLSGAPPVALLRRVIGLDLALNFGRVGVMLGFSEEAMLARVPAGASLVRRLVLVPGRPAESSLIICTEVEACD